MKLPLKKLIAGIVIALSVPALAFAITTVPLTKNGAVEYLTYPADKLGIGTTSPYAPLSVVGQIVGSYFTATTSDGVTQLGPSVSSSLKLGSERFIYTDPDGSHSDQSIIVAGGNYGVLSLTQTRGTLLDPVASVAGDTAGSLYYSDFNGFGRRTISHIDGVVTDPSGSGYLNLNDNLYVTYASGSNNFVGVNTPSPTNTLEITGTFYSHGGDFRLIDGGTSDVNAARMFSNSGNAYVQGDDVNIRSKTAGGLAIFKSSTGNAGIGTSSPYKKLSVGGDVVVGAATAGGTLGDLYLPKTGTAAGTFLAADPTGKVIATTTPASGGSGTVNSGLTGQTAYYQTSGTAVNGTSTIFIATNQNVGIGTSTPISPFTVESSAVTVANILTNAAASANNGGLLSLGTFALPTAADQRIGAFGFNVRQNNANNNGALISAFSSEPWTIGSNQGTYLSLQTTQTGTASRSEKVRIQGDGKVGIGTSSPYSTLSVVGTTTAAVFEATTTATSTSKGGWNITGGCFAISGTCLSTGSSYTFSTGLTNTANTITNNLSTGVAGGQTVTGGTNASNNLTLRSTSNPTKGDVKIGSLFAVGEGTGNVIIGGSNTSVGPQLVVSTGMLDQQMFSIKDGNTGLDYLNMGDGGLQIKEDVPFILGGLSVDDSFNFMVDDTSNNYGFGNSTFVQAINGGWALMAGETQQLFMKMDVSGNLGIGSSTPYARLSVESDASTGDAFAVSTSTGNAIGGYDNDGHRFTSGYTPKVSSCGTGTGTVVGDDQSGDVTTATAATTCTVTFSKAYQKAPVCTVTDNSLSGFADVSSVSTSAVTFGISSALTGGHLYYSCSYHK